MRPPCSAAASPAPSWRGMRPGSLEAGVRSVQGRGRAAVADIDSPQLQPPQQVQGIVLANCCRWYEFEVTQLDDSQERTRIDCRIVHTGRVRDFFGFNRGKHAVVEAAILATRTAFLPANQILDELAKLHVLVDKTGSEQERRAFQLLQTFVSDSVYRSHLSSK